MKEKSEDCQNLINAYNALKNTTLVLSDKFVSELLKVVAESDSIYNLIAEKILGFNYSKCYDDLLANGVDIVTNNKEIIIPFVFCMLNEIDNGKLLLIEFLGKVYGESSEENYKNFLNDLIKPFVDEIVEKLFVLEKKLDIEKGKLDIESIITPEIEDRMRFVTSAVSNKLSSEKKVNNDIKIAGTTICYSIDLCLDSHELIGVFGLFYGLKSILQGLKKFKNEQNEINLLLNLLD